MLNICGSFKSLPEARNDQWRCQEYSNIKFVANNTAVILIWEGRQWIYLLFNIKFQTPLTRIYDVLLPPYHNYKLISNYAPLCCKCVYATTYFACVVHICRKLLVKFIAIGWVLEMYTFSFLFYSHLKKNNCSRFIELDFSFIE